MIKKSENNKYRDLMSDALKEIKRMQDKIMLLESNENEPIAIVNIACRFGNDVDSPDKFWELLCKNENFVKEFRKNRWNTEQYYDEDKEQKGKHYTKHASMISNVDKFDAEFFGISPREAAMMDPQQRILLEVVWEALENVGLSIDGISEKKGGVFIGSMTQDYSYIALDPKQINAHSGTGISQSVLAGRISHIFGLRGPAITIDTACSSSLVAIHLACQSLLSKECDFAIAGGVNLILSPVSSIIECKAKMLSPDGACKTFDKDANGYVRGEGCGIIVLERLSDAIQKKRKIISVIKGSSVNHCGHSSGLTVPDEVAQAELIRDTIKKAKIKPGDISYLEAHGTGTSLGDPIEMAALKEVFNNHYDNNRPLYIGSVKTNIGHTEGAAGVAGIIKAAYVLKNGVIPANLHFNTPNPEIPWNTLNFKIPHKNKVIPLNDKTKRAGVSSFGFSGINAHVILESYENEKKKKDDSEIDNDETYLLPISANSNKSLIRLASEYHSFLRNNHEHIKDICYTTAVGRKHFDKRICFVGSTVDTIQNSLYNVDFEKIKKHKRKKNVFLLTGLECRSKIDIQKVCSRFPIFNKIYNECSEIVNKNYEISILKRNNYKKKISKDLNLFIIQYAICHLLESIGITPDILLGYELSEYVAAAYARIFCVEDAMRLIVEQNKMISKLPDSGCMLKINATREQCISLIGKEQNNVSIAIVNMPDEIVVSGPIDKVMDIYNHTKNEGISATFIDGAYGYHSPQMKLLKEKITEITKKVIYTRPKIDIIPSLYGEMNDDYISSSDYWCDYLINRIDFDHSLKNVMSDKEIRIIEIGFGKSFIDFKNDIDDKNKDTFYEICDLTKNDINYKIMTLIGKLYEEGIDISWEKIYSNRRQLIHLPKYQFDRKRYWIDKQQTNGDETNNIKEIRNNSIWKEITEGNINKAVNLYEHNVKIDESIRPYLINFIETLYTITKNNREQYEKENKYQVKWIEKELINKEITSDNKTDTTWLIIEYNKEHEIRKDQKKYHGVYHKSNKYKKWSENVFKAELYSEDDVKNVINKIFDKFDNINIGLIFSSQKENKSIYELPNETYKALNTILTLIKNIIEIGKVDKTRIYIHLQNTLPYENESIKKMISFAPVWGFMKSILLEYPKLIGGCVNFVGKEIDDKIEEFIETRNRLGDTEKFALLTKEKIYVERICKAINNKNENNIEISSSKTYLITGGTGAVGLAVAEILVQNGACHIILLGRRCFLDENKEKIISSLRKKCKVEIVRANVSQYEEVKKIFEKFGEKWPILGGIVHTAGVSEVCPAVSLSSEKIRKIGSAKIEGTLILHRLTEKKDIDFFTCISSIAAIWGGVGQAHYSAANYFIDAIMKYRRKIGLVGNTINYGPIIGGGMLTENNRITLEKMGIYPLSLNEVKDCFLHLLRSNELQAIFINVKWSKFVELFEFSRQTELFSLIGNITSNKQKTEINQNYLNKIKESKKDEKKNIVIQMLQEKVATVLGFKDTSEIDPFIGFFDMGIDSLLAIELKESIEETIGKKISSTVIFDFPNIEKLADFILKAIEDDIKDEHINKNEMKTEEIPIDKKGSDHVVVTAMSCKLPGGVENPEEFWSMLINGDCAITDGINERWESYYYNNNESAPGKTYTCAGGYLDNISTFDAGFFGISPNEALSMDPQQRILLEVAWHSLEDAGLIGNDISLENMGIFIGATTNEYAKLITENNGYEGITAYHATGNTMNSIAGRLAFVFGANGPCITLDTACSSSLVAVHCAVESLKRRECNIALVGGTNLILSPESTIATAKAKMLSKKGICSTFDDSADGYVRGEGCAVIILKRKEEAINDNDNIWATIVGSGMNHNGASGGFTVPNGSMQEMLLKSIASKNNINPKLLGYIEAHGTGTSLGDPIEIGAINRAYCEKRDEKLYVGSVKTNIGHLEAAAGITGLIKIILMVNKKVIPRNLHLTKKNSRINWDEMKLDIPTSNIEWMDNRGKTRYAAVSSFGVSGTNAHVIIQEPDSRSVKKNKNRSANIFTISAKTSRALDVLVNNYCNYLKINLNENVEDICSTTQIKRLHFRYRLSLVSNSVEEILTKLVKWKSGDENSGVYVGECSQSTEIILRFNSDINQNWQKIIKSTSNHEFNGYIKETLNILNEVDSCWSNGRILSDDPKTDNEKHILSFIFQYSQAMSLNNLGIIPKFVSGDGVGCLSAAVICGKINLTEAIHLLCKMISKGLLIKNNSESAAIEFVKEEIGNNKTENINTIQFILYNNECNWSWWKKAIFPDCTQYLNDDNNSMLIDIGHNNTNIKNTEKIFDNKHTNKDLIELWINEVAAKAHTNGIKINWLEYNSAYVKLPNYPFDKNVYWLPKKGYPEKNNRSNDRKINEAVGSVIHMPDRNETHFEAYYNSQHPEYLNDHRLYETVVVPGSSHLSAIIEIVNKYYKLEMCEIKEISFKKAMILNEMDNRNVRFVLKEADPVQINWSLFSCENDMINPLSIPEWEEHGSGKIYKAGKKGELEIQKKKIIESDLNNTADSVISGEQFYNDLKKMGYDLGSEFQKVEKIWIEKEKIIGKIKSIKENGNSYISLIHPGVLDSCFQLIAAIWEKIDTDIINGEYLFIPVNLNQLNYFGQTISEPRYCIVNDIVEVDQSATQANITIIDENGNVIITINKLTVRKISKRYIWDEINRVEKNYTYNIAWKCVDDELSEKESDLNDYKWLFFNENNPLDDDLIKNFSSSIASCNYFKRPEFEDTEVISEKLEKLCKNALDSVLQKPEFNKLGIVFTWNPINDLSSSVSTNKLMNSQYYTSAFILKLVKMIIKKDILSRTKIIIVTTSVQQVEKIDKIEPANAILWGVGRSLLQELPELDIQIIDRGITGSDSEIQNILKCLNLNKIEREIAIRGNKCYVPVLKRLKLINKKHNIVDSKAAAYVITGGHGGIGLSIARSLGEMGAKRLYLISRRGERNEKIKKQVKKVISLGVEVVSKKIDVADSLAVNAFFEEIKNEKVISLKGIIHAAGIIDDGIITNQNTERLMNVIKPKVAGVWNLHQAVKNEKLDFFLCFSSSSSIFGSKGQFAYCSANAFLDSFTYYRKRLGYPCATVNWGPWGTAGMVDELSEEKKMQIKKYGIETLSENEGVNAIIGIVSNSLPQVLVQKSNWYVFIEQILNRRKSLFAHLIEINENTNKDKTEGCFWDQIELLSFEEKKNALHSHLKKLLADVLGMNDSDEIDESAGFYELGLDSLSSVELKQRIESSLKRKLKQADILNYPSIIKMVSYILSPAVDVNDLQDNGSNQNDELFNENTDIDYDISDQDIIKLLVEE